MMIEKASPSLLLVHLFSFLLLNDLQKQLQQVDKIGHNRSLKFKQRQTKAGFLFDAG